MTEPPRILVQRGTMKAVPVVLYVVDGEPKASSLYATTSTDLEFVERDDAYVQALRRMAIASGIINV